MLFRSNISCAHFLLTDCFAALQSPVCGVQDIDKAYRSLRCKLCTRRERSACLQVGLCLIIHLAFHSLICSLRSATGTSARKRFIRYARRCYSVFPMRVLSAYDFAQRAGLYMKDETPDQETRQLVYFCKFHTECFAYVIASCWLLSAVITRCSKGIPRDSATSHLKPKLSKKSPAKKGSRCAFVLFVLRGAH